MITLYIMKNFIIFNKERRSENTNFLAKIYDNKGSYLSTIAFCESEIRYRKINIMYSWGWEVDNGLKTVFGVTSAWMFDFWHGFDFIKEVYTDRNRFY